MPGDLCKIRNYFTYEQFSYITVENMWGGHMDFSIVKDIYCEELNSLLTHTTQLQSPVYLSAKLGG